MTLLENQPNEMTDEHFLKESQPVRTNNINTGETRRH